MENNPSKELKSILDITKWTQVQLAEQLNVQLKTVNGWITGRAEPNDENIAKIHSLYEAIEGYERATPEVVQKTEAEALTKHMSFVELQNSDELRVLILANLTYHTNAIEGSTMTLEEVTSVLTNDGVIIGNKPLREQVEVMNHKAAFDYITGQLYEQGDNFKWTEQLILNTHLRLQNGLIYTAGRWRNHGVYVRNSDVDRALSRDVPQLMSKLIDYMNTPISKGELVERLAKTHADFELIHPFNDGNGRTGRLIMFTEALRNRITPPLVLRDRKRAYCRYLDHAHKTGDLNPLRLFIAESILYTDRLIKGKKDII